MTKTCQTAQVLASGGQYLRLRPGAGCVSLVYIRGIRPFLTKSFSGGRAHNRPVARNRHAVAEITGTDADRKFLLQNPCAGRAFLVYVSRVLGIFAHNNLVARNRHAVAEISVRNNAGGEFLRLKPDAVCASLVYGNRFLVMVAHDNRAARNRHCSTKSSVHSAGGKFLRLGPGAVGIPVEHIDGIIFRRTRYRDIARNRHGLSPTSTVLVTENQFITLSVTVRRVVTALLMVPAEGFRRKKQDAYKKQKHPGICRYETSGNNILSHAFDDTAFHDATSRLPATWNNVLSHMFNDTAPPSFLSSRILKRLENGRTRLSASRKIKNPGFPEGCPRLLPRRSNPRGFSARPTLPTARSPVSLPRDTPLRREKVPRAWRIRP